MKRPGRRGHLFLAAAAVLAVVAVGCAAEPDPNAAVILEGVAYAAEGAISIETDEWTYGVPLEGVRWRDAEGVWHDSGRPECLLPREARIPVRFAAVEVTIEGTTWRPVVWVDCQG